MTLITRGIIFVILSQIAFSLMDSTIKGLGESIPVATILFFRNLVTLIWMLPIFLQSGEVKASFKRLHLHAIRSFSGQFGMILIFLSLTLLPLADTTVLRSLTPLFVPILAAIWLKERLSWLLIPCFALALLGSWMLAGMDKPHFSLLSLLPIIAGIFVAMAMVAIKRMTQVAPGAEIVFYFSLTGVIVALIFGYFTEFSLPKNGKIWALVVVMGLLGSLGQIWVTRANLYAPASILAPFYYLNAVFGAILSHFFWHETLGVWGWTGAGLVILSGLLLTFKEELFPSRRALKME